VAIKVAFTAPELAQFYQNLASLIYVGVPLAESFDILKQDCESLFLAQAIAELQRRAQQGLSLTECFATSRFIMSAFAKRLLSDALTPEEQYRALMALADERKHTALIDSIKRKLLFWPIVYLVFAGMFLVLLSLFVLPGFQSFYDGFDVALPLLTRVMLFFGPNAFLLGIGFLALWYGLYRSQRPLAQALRDRILMWLPVLGGLRKKIAVHQFLRLLSLLLLRKVPTDEALTLAANSLDTQYVAQAFQESLHRGNHALLDHLRAIHVVPKQFIKLIDIAERTQTLDAVLAEAVDTNGNAMVDEMLRYQDQIELLFKLGIGVLFALIAAAVYLPIFRMGAVS